MVMFVVRRLISGAVLMLVVSVGTFFLAHLAIGDPTAALVSGASNQATLEAKREQIGLDRPLLEQFWDWFSELLQGNLGVSWSGSPTPLNDELAGRFPVTLAMVVYGMVLMIVVGAVFGILAGIRPGGWWDRAITWLSVIFFSLPGFLISIVLIYVFIVELRWFPLQYQMPQAKGIGAWIASLTMPAISLALGGIVMLAAQLRNAIVTANNSDWVRTLRSRGLKNASIALHLLRNAAPAALTIVALMFVSLLSGSVILETMFTLPGIGAMTQLASSQGNIPVILALTVLSVLFVVIVNFLLDLLLGWINPKARVK
ncbi:MAG: ABC transporter permease [Microbacteriaceae bacterium]